MEVNEWKSVAATGRRGRVLPSSYQAPQQISTEGECAGGEGRSSRTLPPLPPVRLMMTVERFRSRTVHASRSVHHIRAGLGHPPPWQTPYPAQHSIQSRAAHGAAWRHGRRPPNGDTPGGSVTGRHSSTSPLCILVFLPRPTRSSIPLSFSSFLIPPVPPSRHHVRLCGCYPGDEPLRLRGVSGLSRAGASGVDDDDEGLEGYPLPGGA